MYKHDILANIEENEELILNISRYIYENTEESFKEEKCSNYLIKILEENNFKVTPKLLDLDSSFMATYGEGHPKLCFICHYDAFPKLGHIKGHNVISAISMGAAIALSKVIDETKGSIVVIGCPGECVGNSVVTMSKQGIFTDLDCVFMVQPYTKSHNSGRSKAILPLSIKFIGDSGLTYLNKDKYSAFDAALLLIDGLKALKSKVNNETILDFSIFSKCHTPSLKESESEIKIYIRSSSMCEAEKIEEKIKKLSTCICEIMNLEYKCNIYELPYTELKSNNVLSRLFNHNLKECGIIDIEEDFKADGGLSLGSISNAVPCIVPFVRVTTDPSIQFGTEAFANATISDFGEATLLTSCRSLALTGLDILENEHILPNVQDDFNQV